MRRLLLGAVCVLLVASAHVSAQRRRRPRGLLPETTVIDWTLFVSAHGNVGAVRTEAGAAASAISIAETPYDCRYSEVNRQVLDPSHWSEVRTVECTLGTTLISTTAVCQIAGSSWGAHAGVLYLGERGSTERVQVSLDCSVRPPG